MKTIPVSLIVAGILLPVVAVAQPPSGSGGNSPREGERRGGQRGHFEVWKTVDKNHDGFISPEEFAAMPRVQNIPEAKRGELFKRLDKNGDGKLAREELNWMGKPHEGQGAPMQRLWELDVDRSGGVSFEEFKAGVIFQKLPPERQEAIFKRLDTNGDGIISPQDKPEPPFKRDGDGERSVHPDRMRPDGPPREPRQIIRQFDKDGDGAVSFEEFTKAPPNLKMSEDEVEDKFEAMDKNHDQKLTPEDFPQPAPRRPEGGVTPDRPI